MTAMLLVPVEGDLRLVEVDGFRKMAAAIGAEYVESVRVALEPEWSMAVDEEGRLRGRLPNPRATALYGSWGPIAGDVLLAREGLVDGGRDWVDTDEADARAVVERRCPVDADAWLEANQ